MTGREKATWIGTALVVAALVASGRLLPFRELLHAFEAWIAGLGPAGYVLYVLAYVLVAVLMMPAVLMTLGAGFAFGLLPGFAVVAAGATLGAASSFLIARHLARARVARFAGGQPRYAAIDRAVAREGWRIVFLLRLSPLVPYVMSNYFYGLTGIGFWPYVAASAIGMMPLTFLYVSFGAAARQAVGDPTGPAGAWTWILLVVGILVTLAATLYARRVVRKALAETAGGGR